MGGYVQADSPSVYLLHGWGGNEDEDVDVDSSGESSEGGIQGLRQHALSTAIAARQPVSSKKVLDSAETSVQATSDAGGQECDSSAAKLGTKGDRTSRDVEQIPTQTVFAKQVYSNRVTEEGVASGESSGTKGVSRLIPRKLNDRKRLDARRFRDHFAAKLVGSKRPNLAKGIEQGEAGSPSKDKVGSPSKDKVILSSSLEPSKGESPQDAGLPTVVRNSSIEIEEEVVMLHVNLEVEQEKGAELPCNGDCIVANKESFQVFTRKRKQASEGATQSGTSEKVSSQNRNGVELETTDERSSDPKDSECRTDVPPESPKSNGIYGRSKRARKRNRQTDYIPWSDFGRLSAKKSEILKSEILVVDSAPGTETASKRTGSKSSSEKMAEDSMDSLSRETRVSAQPSPNEDPELEKQDNQRELQTSIGMNVVEKEHDTTLLACQSASPCPASVEKQEALLESPGEIVENRDKHQARELDSTKSPDGGVKDCGRSNGTTDFTEAGSLHRMEVSQSKPGIGHDPDRDPNHHTISRVEEQVMHEDRSATLELHSREDVQSSMKEGTEAVDFSNCQQEGNDGVEPPKGITKDEHDSACNKCKREGKLICCDGKNCTITFHIDCLEPPLKDVPPNDWYCPRCACKRLFGGMQSVSKGIESIWDVKALNDVPDGGAAQREGRAGAIKQPEGAHETTAIKDAATTVTEHPLQKCSFNHSHDEKFYYVKYKGVAHAHNLWLPESRVSREAAKLLINYKKQVEHGKAPQWDPEWSKPFRVIGRRKTMLAKISGVFPDREHGVDIDHCIEWCIKWKNLGYEACTWEPADKTLLNNAHSKKLIEDYESRSAKAMRFNHAEDTCKVGTHSNHKAQLTGILDDYQGLSEVIEKLLSLWRKHINGIAVDEIHQDRMRVAVGFLVCLVEKFEVSKPSCVIVPQHLLDEWKAAFRKWIPTANVILYAGSNEARKIIQRYEFYNEDGFCMVQIILTSFDTLNLDMEILKELKFEALIVDECQRLKGTKISKSLRQLASSYRLLLLSEPIKNTAEDYHYLLEELAGEKDLRLHEATLVQLRALVSKHIVQEAKQESSSPTEFWVPVKMTAFQLDQYCNLLIEKCDLLVRNKRGDIASSPQELLLKMRECCNHPFLVKPGFQESLTNLTAKELLDFGIRASGKLKLLDTMLWEAKSSHKRVVIITQINLRAGKVSQMDVLDDYMRQQFGIDSYERLDGGVDKSKKSAVVQRFNASNSKSFVFLLDRRACGSAIKLHSVNCIVIFDSDWNPQTDIQSLLRMYSLGDLEHMTICRFYCTSTVEERVLISARKHSDLESNHHNFTLAFCQKLLRWGASKNFELLDNLSRDKDVVKPTDEVIYPAEIIKCFLENGFVESTHELCTANALWRTALFPRKASQYNEGLPLYEEKDEELAEEEKVTPTEFWSDLLRDRQVEAPDLQVRELRARKKVQYHEDPLDVINPSQASVEEEEESRRKRRKVAETPDFPPVGKGARSASVERNPNLGADVPNCIPTAENLERAHINKASDHVERSAAQRLKPGAAEIPHSSTGMDRGYVNRTGAESRTSHGEPESTDNEAMNDPTAGAKSEQQQLLLSMKPDLDKLCRALQFQADTAGHVEQLLYSIGNFFKLPKDRSLLHAVELSLCWLAAEQQHYSIDRRATLALAERCFGVQLDKIETVYAKLEERWKKRLEQGVQQLQGTKGQEKEAAPGSEIDPASRVTDQDPYRDTHGVVHPTTNLRSLEAPQVVGQESAGLRDPHLSKQGPVISVTNEQQSLDAAPHEADTSATPVEGQVSVEQVQVPAEIQESVPLEPSADGYRAPLSHQERSERSHNLINAQKSQIASLELLERKYKQRLKQQYESAHAKFSRTASAASAEEQTKLLEGWRSASNHLTNSFRVIRGNLIKQQYEERRGREHRLSNTELGRENVVEEVNRTDLELSEDGILNSFPQGLRAAIQTGDFGSIRISGSDRMNLPPPNAGSVLNSNSPGSQTPNSLDPQSVSLTLNSGTIPTMQLGVDSLEPQNLVNLQQQRQTQQRQVQDSHLQQRRPSDMIASQLGHTSSSTLQNQQRQQSQPQQQRLPFTHPQSLTTSAQRPSSPIPLPQQPQTLTQQPQMVPEMQQSQPLQRGISIPPRYGNQQSGGSGLTPALPSEVTQPLPVPATYTAPANSGRVSSGGMHSANRSQSGQPRLSQQYQNDPLAQEYLRLRKEQEKLKTYHESEKDRIKAQFMKELELLSKKYEVMLQEEESSYTLKASALESNLKKVEMNRRLAEVFRLKNAQESSAVNSVTAGQEVRTGASQGQQSYQQHPAFLVARVPTAGLAQTYAVTTTASAPLFERPVRAPTPSITAAQLAGMVTSSSWHHPQGPISNNVSGLGPQSSNAGSSIGVIGGNTRLIRSTSALASYIEPFRICPQLSIPENVLVPRLSSPVSNSLPNIATGGTNAFSTVQVQDLQGLNIGPVGSHALGASNHGNVGSVGGISTNHPQLYASSVAPQCNSSPAVPTGLIAPTSSAHFTAAYTLAGVQHESQLSFGSWMPLPETATERFAGNVPASERPTPPVVNNEEPYAEANRCTIVATAAADHAQASPDTLFATRSQLPNEQNHVNNGLGATHSRHSTEAHDHGASDVICLSDDD